MDKWFLDNKVNPQIWKQWQGHPAHRLWAARLKDLRVEAIDRLRTADNLLEIGKAQGQLTLINDLLVEPEKILSKLEEVYHE